MFKEVASKYQDHKNIRHFVNNGLFQIQFIKAATRALHINHRMLLLGRLHQGFTLVLFQFQIYRRNTGGEPCRYVGRVIGHWQHCQLVLLPASLVQRNGTRRDVPAKEK